jgi:exodeoxyribonuclease VII small subunit
MARQKKKEAAAAAPPEDFDARLARLEALVQEMEEGGLGLEGAIGRYEEGVSLLKGCREVLAAYRRQVEELTRDAEQALEPYEGDPDVSEEG